MKILRALGFPCVAKNPNSIFLGLIAGVGDLVLAAPCVIALKKKYPGVKICFGVGGGIFRDIITNDPNIDEFDSPIFYYLPTKNVWKILVRKKLFFKKVLNMILWFCSMVPTKKVLIRAAFN